MEGRAFAKILLVRDRAAAGLVPATLLFGERGVVSVPHGRAVAPLPDLLLDEGTHVNALASLDSREYSAAVVDSRDPSARSMRSSLALCATMRARFSGLGIMVVFGSVGGETKLSALEAGADDCILDPVDPRELVARVRAVIRRVLAARPARETVLARASQLPGAGAEPHAWTDLVRRVHAAAGLTRSEAEVLRLALNGSTRAEIARTRGVTANTMKTEVRSLLGKCGATNLSELALRVYREEVERLWRAAGR